MNTSRKLLLAAAAMISTTALASSAFAQASATASADASATIIKPITLTKKQDMSFGKLVSNKDNAGSSTLSASSDTPTLSNLTALTGGTVQRAKFTVNGESGIAYSVTLPTSAVTMSGSTSGVTLTDFVSDAPSSLSGSDQDFYVGAKLNVPAGAGGGSYTGSFDVTVAYN